MGIMNKFKGLLFLSVFVCFSHSQLKFGGSSSGSGSGSGSGSSNTQNKLSSGDTDQRIISTGNQFVDGGILGLGAGLVGSAVLGGALNGGGSNPCGRRRRRQADDCKTDTRFFGFGSNNGCNCGKRKRDAPGENEPGTRFFGLENLLGGGNNCGCNCGGYYPQNNYPQNNYPQNNYPSSSGFTQQRCQCNYNLTFRDRYGNTTERARELTTLAEPGATLMEDVLMVNHPQDSLTIPGHIKPVITMENKNI